MDVSLSALRTRLKEVMEEVKKGHNVLLTDRGKPVAMIEPIHAPDHDRMAVAEDVRIKNERFKQSMGKANPALDRAKAAQRARDDLLRGVNKKS